MTNITQKSPNAAIATPVDESDIAVISVSIKDLPGEDLSTLDFVKIVPSKKGCSYIADEFKT